MTFRFAIALCLTLCAVVSPAADRDPALAGFFATPLAIETADGRQHAFTAYLAVTPQQRAHGLMFVRNLPDDYGMLFLYEPPQVASMWMKNTVLSLDILFIRPDGTIANIARNTEPGSLAQIRAVEPVSGVLELKAGTGERLNLAPGDRIVYRAFRANASDAVLPATDPR